jgi:hypothetical protein
MADKNYVLGAGKLYFALEDANGNLLGERYFGNTPGFTISIESENLELFDSDGPIAEKVEDVQTQITRQITLTANDIGDDNLGLFVNGDLETVASSAGSVTDERHTVSQGLIYQLGQSGSNPTGVRAVTNVVVNTDPDGTPTPATLGTDYTVDLETGRLEIVVGGGIDNEEIGVDYDTVVGSRVRIVSSSLAAKTGALRFIAENTRGKNRDVYIPRIQLRPNGEFAWKSRDTWQEMQFSGEATKRGNLAAVYIDGRQVA